MDVWLEGMLLDYDMGMASYLTCALQFSLYKMWRVSPCISVVQTGIQASWFAQLKRCVILFPLSHAQVYLGGTYMCVYIEPYMHMCCLFN